MAAVGEDALRAEAHEDQRRRFRRLGDGLECSLGDRIDAKQMRRVDARRLGWGHEERGGQASEQCGRVLAEARNGGRLELETLRAATRDLVIEHGPVEALAELARELTAACAELSRDRALFVFRASWR